MTCRLAKTLVFTMLFCTLMTRGTADLWAQEHAPTQPDISSGTVKGGQAPFRFNGLLQAWYLAGDKGYDDAFQIRRSELKFAGDLSSQVAWTVMIDPAKALAGGGRFATTGTTDVNSTSNRSALILQDAFITLDYHRRVTLDVGQLKVPLSFEGQQSSAELDTERALFMTDRRRGGTFGDIRDIGVMASGPVTNWLKYQIGFFDGTGTVESGPGNHSGKVMAARLVYQPGFLPGLQLGTSGLREHVASEERERRDRLGAELVYRNGPLTLTAEYMTGRDLSAVRKGYYAHFGYRLAPKWAVSLRHDTFDPYTRLDTTPATVTERDYIAGMNYFMVASRVMLQFNYVRKTFDDDIVMPFNHAVVRLQASW